MRYERPTWKFPYFGQFGVLLDDGDRVQCDTGTDGTLSLRFLPLYLPLSSFPAIGGPSAPSGPQQGTGHSAAISVGDCHEAA